MFDLKTLREAIEKHGAVARLVVAAYEGSSPREVGASMLVWASGKSGTIGGGALEYQSILRARERLSKGLTDPLLSHEPLGPKLGQCCGGRVSLLTEIYDKERVISLSQEKIIARPVTGAPPKELPLFLQRLISKYRKSGVLPAPHLSQGWMIEPVENPRQEMWIWGAGHVGRAMVDVLLPLPDFAITWVDVARDRFPETIPENLTPIWSEMPNILADHAPKSAHHLILTYSHALDLELCHRLLNHGFGWLGLIGSETKWLRFCSRLQQLGHKRAAINRITCPIGDPRLGKHPQQIAIGVAVQLLKLKALSETEIADDTWDERAFAP